MKYYLVTTKRNRLTDVIIKAETADEAKEIWKEVHDPNGTDWELPAGIVEVDSKDYPEIDVIE